MLERRRTSRTALAIFLCIPVSCAHRRAAIDASPARLAAGLSDEELLREKSLMVPVAGIEPKRLRDTYFAGRGSQIHAALDINAPRGTPVLAADNGRIFRLRKNDAGGITIYQLDRAERFVYYYAHLERYRDGLTEGAFVRQGDVIGYVGTTGNAPRNTPHLHFQLMRYLGSGRYSGGEPLNALPYLVRPGRRR